MKRYKKYMDDIKASDTLHQRLLGLETPAKQPVPWRKYGSMAAALALVLGLGGLGYAHYYHTVVNPTGQTFLERTTDFGPEAASALQPDIAPVEPGDTAEPGQKTLGGYDVREERGGVAMMVHYLLPYIEYGDVGGAAVAADWDIPPGATRRDLTWDECIALMGGKDVVNTHLDWGMYMLSGWEAWYADGSFWGAYINGVLPNYDGPTGEFEFAVTAGQLPPTCIAFPGSVTQEIRGLTVTADGYDGKDGCARRVSFMKADYGYRFDLTSTDVEQAERMVSRLVCRIADKGLNVDGTGVVSMSPPAPREDGLYTCEICGRDFPVGSAHGHPFMGADEPNYEDGVSEYDVPPVSASDSPRSRGEDWCGTPGAGPDDAMCSGYPVPEGGVTCPICGQTLPVGMEHSHEVCHLPLAPEGWTRSSGSLD